MRFAIFQRNHAGRPILDDPHHHLVQIRTTINEEIFVALEDDMLVTLEFNKLERSRANDTFRICRVRLRVLSVTINMLRNDRQQLR